jgi:uncharacterized protein with FMN-binding domain
LYNNKKTKMKKNIKTILVLISSVLIFSCGERSSDKNATQTDGKREKSNLQSNEIKVDGVYTGSKNISGIKLKAKLTIRGNTWSAMSSLGDDDIEYQSGVIKGHDLYDESGMIKIGYVAGNSASISGYPNMSK